MSESIHRRMFDFMATYPDIDKLFSFNFSEWEKSSSLFRVVDDDRRKTDILGNVTGVYSFSIAEYRGYSTDPFTVENFENLEAVDAFIDWVKAQNDAHNFPDLGENYITEKIEAVRTGSGIVAVDPILGVAKYQFTVKVTYERED